MALAVLLPAAGAAALAAAPIDEAIRHLEGREYGTALSLLKPLADQGDPEAQYRLGMMYLQGLGMQPDDSWAVTWLRRAADQGHGAAREQLAKLYAREGVALPLPGGTASPGTTATGSAEPRPQALEGLSPKELAAIEFARAQGLTILYDPTVPPPRQEQKVMREETERPAPAPAAAAPEAAVPAQATATGGAAIGVGDAAGDRSLRVAEEALQQGDYPTAIAELKRLGEAGDSRAQTRLGSLYQVGEGVDRDLAAAADWYTRAARSGDAEAQYNLGNMYLLGEGVEQDDAQALEWYRKAAEQGHAAARQNLENLRRAADAAPVFGTGSDPQAAGGGAPLY